MKNLLLDYYRNKYAYLLLIPLALLMFPHKGIIHDTRLYVFDILNIAYDGVFANDILTLVGSQDKYTLYSQLAAPLYRVLSPWAATAVVFVIGQLLWFSGLIALVRKFAANEKAAFYGLLAAFLLPAQYFGFSVLSYGEGFATPRLFVEALAFWSLWCFFSRAYVISVLLVLVALTLHPIMGLISTALLVGILLQEGRRWWLIFAGTAIAGVIVIAVSGIIPLERFTAVLDGDWFYVVHSRAKYLFVSEWRGKDWARILMSLSILAPMIAIFSGWQRRLIISSLIVAAAGLLVSFIGTDLLHNVLLAQVQTSRSVWFAYLMGNLGFGLVVAAMYRKSEEDGDVFFFLYLLAWTLTHLIWPVPGLMLGIVTSGLAWMRCTGRIAGIPSLFRRLTYVVTVFLFFWLVFLRARFWIEPANRDAVFPVGDGFVGIAGFTQIELVLIIFAVFAVVRLRLNVPAAATRALLVLLTVWAIFVWDRRSDDDRGLEGKYPVADLPQQIPAGANVYWEGTAKGAWFLLRRPSYFADVQGAGAVFSRDQAVEYLKRSKIVRAIDGVDYVDIWRPLKTAEEYKERLRAQKQIGRSDLVAACTGAPELDFLVLTREVAGAYVTAWDLRLPDRPGTVSSHSAEAGSQQRRYLYRCADFR